MGGSAFMRCLWAAAAGLLLEARGDPSACRLSPEEYRESVVLQGLNFDGAYELSLAAGLDCLGEITAPLGGVNQSLHAVADFYEQFYAFRYICIDPEDSEQSQAPPFDFGIYGSARGGGASAEASKVDIVKELRQLAASLPEEPSLADWFLPANTLFYRLRDSHVDWKNGGTKADTVLNQFIFFLQDDSSLEAARIEVSAKGKVVVDGYADARFTSAGRELASIDGLPPMQWFRAEMVENPAFNYGFKSLGPRFNRMLTLGRVGLAWLGSHVGDVSQMKPTVEVKYQDGTTGTWSWRWLLLTRSLSACQRFDAECTLNLLKKPLQSPGTLYANALEAFTALQSAHESALTNVAPEFPDDTMLQRLQEDEGLRSLLRIEEHQVPGTKAHAKQAKSARSAAAEPSEVFPRRWLLDPALSPMGASYGYAQLQRGPEGELFAVMKFPRFYLTPDESGGFDVQSRFPDFWKEFLQEAESHQVTKLLVDVSGNAGGFVDLAYLFVRALFPLLEFPVLCNEYDRPVGSLFEAWRKVNITPLVSFLKSPGASAARVKNLTSAKQRELEALLHGVTRACIALDVLSYDDFMLVQEAVDTLELGEMDADTLQQTVKVLSESAASFGNPFTLYLTAFSAEGQVFNPFEETRFRRRGGQENVELSALFHVEDCVAVYTKQFVDALAGVKNPFKDILFLSDGLCGSSCDTAARTAYMLSQQLAVEEGTPKVRFAAFGGLGGTAAEARRTLSATSFPGGNVMSSAMGLLYNPVFSVAALGYLAALWAGLESMQTQLANFQRLVPQYPYYWEKLPKYPQSEMYQKALGQHSLPAEYYFFPTDFVLPDWYRGIDGMPNRWNESELARLHWDALGAFSGSAWRAAPEAEGSWLMAAFSTGRLGGGGHVVPAVSMVICFVLLATGLAQISKKRRPELADPEALLSSSEASE
ncbi:unnamed protein product [Effrenium voratum]|nr:unnamed protein product [Effrenium voratum]